jgi:O-antigen/teichoic acid export membrane protein
MLGLTNEAEKTARSLPARFDSLLAVAAKIVGGASALLINLFAVRHLVPAVYGVFAFCIANLQLFDALLGAALDLSVLKLAPLFRRNGFSGITPPERASVLVKTAIAGVAIFLLAIFGEQIGNAVFHGPGGRQILVLLGASVLGLLLFRSMQVHSQIDLRFKRYAAADLMQTALRLTLSMGLIVAGVTSGAWLVGGYGAAPFLVTLFLAPLLMRERQTPAPWFDRDACRQMLKQSALLMSIAGFSLLVFNQDMFILALLRGPADVGILRASYTIAFIPELLGTYIGQTVIPRIVPACEAGTFADFYEKFQVRAFLAALPVLVLGLLLVDTIIMRVFPPSYRESLPVIKILFPAGIASLIGYPLTLNFLIFYKPKMFLAIDAVLAPFMAAGYWYAAGHGGVIGVAWVTSVARLVKFAVTQYYALRLSRRIGPQFADK